jgi:hypothetical protein
MLAAFPATVLTIGASSSPGAIRTITIDPKARVSPDRMSATVTGTVNCFFGDQVNMFANITETVGRLQRFARNPSLNTISCTGTT